MYVLAIACIMGVFILIKEFSNFFNFETLLLTLYVIIFLRKNVKGDDSNQLDML